MCAQRFFDGWINSHPVQMVSLRRKRLYHYALAEIGIDSNFYLALDRTAFQKFSLYRSFWLTLKLIKIIAIFFSFFFFFRKRGVVQYVVWSYNRIDSRSTNFSIRFVAYYCLFILSPRRILFRNQTQLTAAWHRFLVLFSCVTHRPGVGGAN